MANVIETQKLIDNNKRALIKYVALIDTADSANVILNASTLNFALNANGYIMTGGTHPKPYYRTSIKRIYGSAHANAYIRLHWDGTLVGGNNIVTLDDGTFNYSFDQGGDIAVISNPDIANSNGNILMTIVTPSATDALTLFIDLKKDARDYDAGQTADPVAFNRGPAAGF